MTINQSYQLETSLTQLFQQFFSKIFKKPWSRDNGFLLWNFSESFNIYSQYQSTYHQITCQFDRFVKCDRKRCEIFGVSSFFVSQDAFHGEFVPVLVGIPGVIYLVGVALYVHQGTGVPLALAVGSREEPVRGHALCLRGTDAVELGGHRLHAHVRLALFAEPPRRLQPSQSLAESTAFSETNFVQFVMSRKLILHAFHMLKAADFPSKFCKIYFEK